MRHPLLLAVLTAVALLALVEVAFRERVKSSYIPERTLASAIAAGDGCVVTLGDSRMVAGVRIPAFGRELARAGTARCHAQLAIGGAHVVAHYLALRRYLAAGRKPKLIVLGITLESALSRELPPDGMIGNQAVALGWSEASDVTLIYPGFPARDFDSGLRFLMKRPFSLTAFGSLAWLRVQAMQDRLVGNERGPTNQFGAVADMQALARSLTRDVSDRIEGFPERVPLHPAFRALVDLAFTHGVPLLLVELPMPAAFRRALTASDRAPALRAELVALIERRGGRHVDLGEPAWLLETHFADGLHLGPEGAERFTAELAAVSGRAPAAR